MYVTFFPAHYLEVFAFTFCYIQTIDLNILLHIYKTPINDLYECTYIHTMKIMLFTTIFSLNETFGHL